MIRRRVLGRVFAWQTADADLHDQITKLTACLPAADGPAYCLFSLERAGDQVALSVDGVEVVRVEPSLAFSVSLEWLAVRASRRDDVCFVHAGMVACDGRALVLPAMSRSGKSTLVTALLELGFTFGSDEFAPLFEDRSVAPYPVPIRMRQSGMEALGELPASVSAWPTTMFRKYEWARFVLPTRACTQERYPVGLIVFLAGFRERESRMRPISAGDAAFRLMSEQLGREISSAWDFDLCTDLAVRVPCYELQLGNPREAAARIAELWAALDDEV